jgi:hypothetical protein
MVALYAGPKRQSTILEAAHVEIVLQEFADAPASLGLRLVGHHLEIEPLIAHELFMRAALDDGASVDHQDEVGSTHGRQAMGDDERGPACEQPGQGLLDKLFAIDLPMDSESVSTAVRLLLANNPGQSGDDVIREIEKARVVGEILTLSADLSPSFSPRDFNALLNRYARQITAGNFAAR